MTRRAAVLALLSMPLGYYKAFAMQVTGWLTIDLGQYRGIKVTLAGKTVEISNVELFEALKATQEEK